ncbi:S1C family serine protease [Corynebacterium sp.]|uniref:S1C family serine protease n=1 Tax=Corynebacterium sp. TaxID=1720 RepID=UPI0026DBECCD|nr:trypsin-like peptidase domain-containing protein [Corynebacterium sp.]MDO5076327.1 trypsin-like peptidase domain-containing protein [Corynebacterium sp.]
MSDANESQSQNKDPQEPKSPHAPEPAQGSETPADDGGQATPAGAEPPKLEDLGTEDTVSLERPTPEPEPMPESSEPETSEYVPVSDWTAAPVRQNTEPVADSDSAEPPIAPGIPPSPSVPPQMPRSGAHLPPSAAPTTAFVQQAAQPPASIPENPYLRQRHQTQAPQEAEVSEPPAFQSPLSNQQPGKVPPQIAGAVSEEPHPAPEPPVKQKRTVGVGTLAALMLVAAIGAGATTGVLLSSRQNTVTQSISALNDAPAPRSGLDEPGNVSEVAKNVLPTVVSIYVANNAEGGTGSGSIISSDGYVLTNNHVVQLAKDGGTIEVLLNDGSIYEADVVAGDVETDVAVIKIRDVQDLPVITFGDSDEILVGDSVLAVGAPHGLTATVTSGIVSALNRPVRLGDSNGEVFIDAIQTDASINPGNSGGPLVNMQGQLVGVNSIIYSETQGSVGLGFAIPANQARRYADQLIKNGSINHPKIGVRLDQRYPGPGALIAKVEPNSPAEKAGISSGDLIVQVGDRRIGETDAVIAAIRALDFGETVKLKVMNPDSKETRDVDVTLPEQ